MTYGSIGVAKCLSWMSQEQVESLAAFVLTAAQKLLVGEQKLLKETAAAINRGLCYDLSPSYSYQLCFKTRLVHFSPKTIIYDNLSYLVVVFI